MAILPELRRSMKLLHATAMVVGIILGATIFIQPSEITRLVPNTQGLFMVWVAAGALTFCGALVCAELTAAFPLTGGIYVFLKRTYSPSLGFLWGWAMFWSMHSGIIAAIAAVLARYVAYFIPLSENGIRLVAISVVLLLSGLNILGVKTGSTVQVVLTIAKVVAIVGMVFLFFWFGTAAHHSLPVADANPAPVPFANYGLAIAAGLFSFGGWHMVTYAAGETLDPERTIPRALLIGTLIVTAAYILLNAGYLYVLPLTDVARSTHVAADATEHVLGTGASSVISAVVILSALGALNGIILAGPRVYYAMAQDGLVFRFMGAVHPSLCTPYLAIIAQALWTSVLVATNSYRQLFTRVVYTEWLFFALLVAGLFILRRRNEYVPVYLKRGYPVVPLLFILASLGIVINQVIADPRGCTMGFGLVLLGLPVYFLWAKFSPKPSSEQNSQPS